jgi:hypothetical protein
MSQELPPLTLGEALTTKSLYDDGYTEKIRGLNQAVKNAASTPLYQETDWTAGVTHSIDYGTIGPLTAALTTGATGATGATGSLSQGYTYTTNTTNPYTIGAGNYGTGLGNGNISIANTQFEQNGKMTLKGTKADIEINGKSMTAWMEKVEQRLNILTPNPELEKDWDDLRRLGERYRKLEKKCQEKAQMWEALKKLPKPKL